MGQMICYNKIVYLNRVYSTILHVNLPFSLQCILDAHTDKYQTRTHAPREWQLRDIAITLVGHQELTRNDEVSTVSWCCPLRLRISEE